MSEKEAQRTICDGDSWRNGNFLAFSEFVLEDFKEMIFNIDFIVILVSLVMEERGHCEGVVRRKSEENS